MQCSRYKKEQIRSHRPAIKMIIFNFIFLTEGFLDIVDGKRFIAFHFGVNTTPRHISGILHSVRIHSIFWPNSTGASNEKSS